MKKNITYFGEVEINSPQETNEVKNKLVLTVNMQPIGE